MRTLAFFPARGMLGSNHVPDATLTLSPPSSSLRVLPPLLTLALAVYPGHRAGICRVAVSLLSRSGHRRMYDCSPTGLLEYRLEGGDDRVIIIILIFINHRSSARGARKLGWI